ncbi:hypothetical protein [Paenibacillus sp. MMS20-IR301]|uniref:hypothetical protein n=1 Tax=Paenibacillus sp. MMS20-IR301 TaxID=2895946 RepID=UPI0028E83B96|nr:hypothetical protein [Paenibacillus sp. MMS20-IR301]WNS44701.1 hypothetical protein LOS79_05345 [Paenibacillus sp. MMS20-IR301]
MIYILIVLYAMLMGAAAILKSSKLGIPLTAANLLGSLALLCTLLYPLLLPFGLIMLLGCALCNGYVLQGFIRVPHVAVRCVISLAIYTGYFL